MLRFVVAVVASFALIASAAAQPAKSGGKRGKKRVHEFKENRTGTSGLSRGVKASKIKPTRTEAALRFTLVDKDKGPIKGIVIKLTAPRGKTYFTDETDAKGYTELLVPVGQKYELEYLSLGRRKISARIPVDNGPAQTIRLTLRYKRYEDPRTNRRSGAQNFILEGVHFETGKATIRRESFPRLDRVVEYMTHKTSARIEISGHTDNVGKARRNKALSRRRALACRKYLISKGIAGRRIQAVGFGAERPIASNATVEGRAQNRRIEAVEL